LFVFLCVCVRRAKLNVFLSLEMMMLPGGESITVTWKNYETAALKTVGDIAEELTY